MGGWAQSRETPAPEPTPSGWYIRTGTGHEAERWVLTDPTPASLSEVLRVATTTPTSCVKFAGDPAQWLPRLGTGWVEDHPGWYMTRALDDHPPPAAPPGLRCEVATRPGLVIVDITDADGERVAWGRAGLADGWAVPDQINTLAQHRRRGLGRLVMSTLDAHAYVTGATRAVLSASTDGRALYRALGWREVSPMVGVYYRPDRS